MARHAATVCFLTPLGPIEIEASASGVTRVRFSARGVPREVGEGKALAVARLAEGEIRAYLAGELRAFSVPVAISGTDFQLAVWSELRRVRYGETTTYGEIAARLGKPRAARAVGSACRTNPVAMIVPCHRVLSGHGELTGFNGGLERKRSLLELEHVPVAAPR